MTTGTPTPGKSTGPAARGPARPMLLGIAAAAGFAATFVLNRSMSVQGGSWMWSACLRFLFMLGPLVLLVALRGGLRPVLRSLGSRPGLWLLWSTVGFGLFYAPLTWAADAGPGWLTAAAWQLTIVAGMGIGAASGQGLPRRTLAVSALIVAGVVLTQVPHAGDTGPAAALRVVLPVLIAAVAYPLGNRRLIGVDGLDGVQRTLAMTIGSLPLWLLTAAAAGAVAGAPPAGQVVQCLVVALLSGVVATTLFFRATDRARGDSAAMGAVEATQAAEVPFALLAEVLLLGAAVPDPVGWTGLALVLAGLTAHALQPRRPAPPGTPPDPGDPGGGTVRPGHRPAAVGAP
ncbi:multidrug resistance efflux transporter family protein [Streptomyces thermolineatus]|uniref:DMT family transporter n=1 Tax=Streptomyces thermolineatus TaxID=44033 RepID=UPI00384EF3C3